MSRVENSYKNQSQKKEYFSRKKSIFPKEKLNKFFFQDIEKNLYYICAIIK